MSRRRPRATHPLTSLRTNIDLLVRSERTGRAIPAQARATILDRLQAQAAEFSTLVSELVELARDNHELARDDVAMTTVIGRAVRRATGRAPEHVIDVDSVELVERGGGQRRQRTGWSSPASRRSTSRRTVPTTTRSHSLAT